MKRGPVVGVLLIAFWVYLSFLAYPSVAWVGNGNVHVINWDGFNNWYVGSVEEADGFGVVVLTEPDEGIVDNLLAQGRKVLVLTNESSGCSGNACYMPMSFSDADYKYPLFYLAGFPWLYWLNMVAPVFLLLGLVLLKDVFLDSRFAVLVIFLFALFGARKYMVGMPVTVDFAFHEQKLALISEGKVITDLFANGMTTWHYYPPMFYWFWSLFVHFIGLVETIRLLAFFTLFFAGISAYVAIRKLTETKYATVVAVFYMLYPFLLFDINLRGGFSEAFGLALIPWVFLSLSRTLEGQRKYGFLLIVFLSLIMLTHIFTTMILLLSVALFIFSFDVDAKTKLRAFSYALISLLAVSFWLVPLFVELSFTSHTMMARINPIKMFIPNDWNCAGKCLMNAFYAGIVFFSVILMGFFSVVFSKKRRIADVPFIWVFILLVVFLFGSDVIFGMIPVVSSLPQQNFRSLIVLGFVSCFFAVSIFDSLSRVKGTGRLKNIGNYLFIILLLLFVLDVYKTTGARVHSNSEMIALFSLDGFQNLLDPSQNTYNRVVMPEEIIQAMSTRSDGNLFVSLEPDMINPAAYFGHELQPQVSAAVFLGRNVAGPFPYESTSNRYFYWYSEASYSLLASETEETLQQENSMRFAELMGYLGVDTVVMTSGRHENGCMEIVDETENLFVYNNTCAGGRVSTYRNIVEEMGKDQFFREYVVFYGANETEQVVDVSVLRWEDGFVELEVEGEGYVMLRKTAYPDWELYVDGVREEILVAEPAFIAFHTNPGTHSVKLVYSYWNWRHLVGFLMSCLALVVLAITHKLNW